MELRSFYDLTLPDNDGLIKAQAWPGAEITATITEAIAIAEESEASVEFNFNGVTVTVYGDSVLELIYRDWYRAMRGYINKSVGPYPKQVLSDEELASDRRIAIEKNRQRQLLEKQWKDEARRKRQAVDAKLDAAAEIELSDEPYWQAALSKNTDPYGKAVLTYAELWARLMQVEIASGKPLEEIAESASREADLEGITGAMYGAAVAVLARCWKHGERLRVWHNRVTQLGNEGDRANESGGVLNPAMLNIS